MRRIKTFISLSSALILCGALACSCNSPASAKGESDGFKYSYNDKQAYVYEFDWTEDVTEITIPDSIDGLPVTAMGGTFSGGTQELFHLNCIPLNDLPYYNPPTEYKSLEDKVLSCDEVIYYDITLNIGEHMKHFNLSGSPFVYELRTVDGKNFAYIYRFYINCDSENIYYYSRDGVLYDSATDKPISSFLYWSDSVTK